MQFSRKSVVQNYLAQEPIVCLAEFYAGKPNSWLCTRLGTNPNNTSDICVFDLSADPLILGALNDEELNAELKRTPSPIRWIRSNGCPILMPADKAPRITKALEFERSILIQRLEYLRQNRVLRDRLVTAAATNRTEYERSTYVEQQIYDGFFSDADQQLMGMFHQLPWDKRPEVVGKFTDLRLRTIGNRLIYFENPELLPDAQRRVFDHEFASKLLSLDKHDWLTLPQAIEETDLILKDAKDSAGAFLSEYRAFLSERLEAAKKIHGHS